MNTIIVTLLIIAGSFLIAYALFSELATLGECQSSTKRSSLIGSVLIILGISLFNHQVAIIASSVLGAVIGIIYASKFYSWFGRMIWRPAMKNALFKR